MASPPLVADDDGNLDVTSRCRRTVTVIFARLLNRLAQSDAATINFIAALFQSLRNVHRSDRAVEKAVLADLARKVETAADFIFPACSSAVPLSLASFFKSAARSCSICLTLLAVA